MKRVGGAKTCHHATATGVGCFAAVTIDASIKMQKYTCPFPTIVVVVVVVVAATLSVSNFSCGCHTYTHTPVYVHSYTYIYLVLVTNKVHTYV